MCKLLALGKKLGRTTFSFWIPEKQFGSRENSAGRDVRHGNEKKEPNILIATHAVEIASLRKHLKVIVASAFIEGK